MQDGEETLIEISQAWDHFCICTEHLLNKNGALSIESELFSSVKLLCQHGLVSLVQDHFLRSLEEIFKRNGVMKFWMHFEPYHDFSSFEMHDTHEDWAKKVLRKSLDEIFFEKKYQEKCLSILFCALQSYEESISQGSPESPVKSVNLFSRYQMMASSILLATLPRHFPEVLRFYFKGRLEELSTVMTEEGEDGYEAQSIHEVDYERRNRLSPEIDEMDVDESYRETRLSKNSKLVKNIGKVVHDLRNLGFTSMTEDAYASAIFLLLKNKVQNLAGDDYRSPVLESIKEWIKLELQFEDQVLPFTVAPVHAAIIMQFQEQPSWTSKTLAATIGVPVETLNRRIGFWISKGILAESLGTESDDHVFTLVDDVGDTSRNGARSYEGLLVADEEGERSMTSVEDQMLKEMTVYEKFIIGMLTNFGSMALDRIHNTLKMFCAADPPYDKSLQQLQSFLSGLISEEKLDLRDGMYFLKK